MLVKIRQQMPHGLTGVLTRDWPEGRRVSVWLEQTIVEKG